MIQFLIEASYWSAYYMKWKNEDHIPFFTGIYTVVVTLIINIMTLLIIIQLHTNWTAIDDVFDLLPDGFMIKENKPLMMLFGVPIVLILTAILSKVMYSKMNRKEIMSHFKRMPPKRQTIGKTIFILYFAGSIILALALGSIIGRQKNDAKENIRLNQRREMMKEIFDNNDTLQMYKYKFPNPNNADKK